MEGDEPSLKRFERVWRENFPDDQQPSLSCLNQEGYSETEKFSYRNALKVALDYYDMRIQDLQKKLQREQFVLEFIANELEKLPIPRQSPTPKPKPVPRTPPSIPAKPRKPSEDDHRGVLKRNKTTPSPQHSGNDKRFQFHSVHLPSHSELDSSTDSTSMSNEQVIVRNDSNKLRNGNADREPSFSTFKSTSFKEPPRPVSGAGEASVKRSESSRDSAIRPLSTESSQSVRKVGRDSMKRMEQIVITDSQSSTDDEDDDSSTPASSARNSDYMHLWNIPAKPNTVSISEVIRQRVYLYQTPLA